MLLVGRRLGLEEVAVTSRALAGVVSSPTVKEKLSVASSLIVRLTMVVMVGGALTREVSAAELLAKTMSAVELTTMARLVIRPAVGALTLIVAVALAPLEI